MPSSSIPGLSQELIDKIIDHVDSDLPRNDLLQCALVSRSFRPRSQMHIFSTIYIPTNGEIRERKIRVLFEILHDNPRVVYYIQELSLALDSQYLWIAHDPTFITLMNRISTSRPLRKLTMNAGEVLTGCQAFEGPPADHQQLLDHFFLPFITPFITSLYLDWIQNVPVEVVASCINLTVLVLLNVGFMEASEDRISTGLHRPKLQRFEFLPHWCSTDLRNMQMLLNPTSNGSQPAILDFSGLKSFIVYTDRQQDLEFEQPIIDASRNSLEEIYIITLEPEYNRHFHGFINLQNLPCLRVLHAHALFPEDSLVSICRILSTIPQNSLESLFIEAKVAFCEIVSPQVVLDADWATFCLQVARVMSRSGSRFEFKMTYMFCPTPLMGMDEYTDLLETRCECIIEKLKIQKLKSLEDYSRLTVALSYDIEEGIYDLEDQQQLPTEEFLNQQIDEYDNDRAFLANLELGTIY